VRWFVPGPNVDLTACNETGDVLAAVGPRMDSVWAPTDFCIRAQACVVIHPGNLCEAAQKTLPQRSVRDSTSDRGTGGYGGCSRALVHSLQRA